MIGGIEHIGIFVTDPVAMAEWYKRVLGFDIVASSAKPGNETVFLRDSAGRTIVEVCRAPGVSALASRIDSPTQLHIALVSDDPDADAQKLAAEGATRLDVAMNPQGGDILLALRDPWGNTIQLARRGKGREMV